MAVNWEKVWATAGDVSAVAADIADGPDGGEVVYINQAGEDDGDKTMTYLAIGGGVLALIVVVALVARK